MNMILYFYIKDGRIEVTEVARAEPPNKTVTISNDGGQLKVIISFN